MKIITTIIGCVLAFSWVVSRPYAEQPTVTASWYGKAYRGNMCADNKTVYDERDPSIVAHRTLPFGTKLKVSITKNRYIICYVRDRGPFTKDKAGRYSREIDLSRAGFVKLCGDSDAGLIQVKIEVISVPNK